MKTDIYKIKTDQAWNRLYNRLDNDRLLAKVDEGHHTRKYSQWIRYGAVAAVLIGVIWGTLYWVTGSDKELAQHLLTQENQGVSTLATTLEDGSVVLLAKETSLLYPKHFIADKREVSLQGNAFFDVAKKQGQPFWIDTEQAKIEVLGTAFSVQSDENAPFRLSEFKFMTFRMFANDSSLNRICLKKLPHSSFSLSVSKTTNRCDRTTTISPAFT